MAPGSLIPGAGSQLLTRDGRFVRKTLTVLSNLVANVTIWDRPSMENVSRKCSFIYFVY